MLPKLPALSCLRISLLVYVALLGFATRLDAAGKNIVVVVTDDMSPDAGCYGNTAIRTPHLDALAADGVRLTKAFATTASCSASRSVILTGMYNHASAQYGHAHSYHHFTAHGRLKSLPIYLKEAGYRTARIGKFHVEPEAVFQFEKVLAGNERNTVQMSNNCQEFIAEKSDQPFFLYYCTADPHRSGGEVPGNPYKPNPFGNTVKGYPGVTEVTYDPEKVLVPPFLPDTPTCRNELAQYYQSISRVDAGLGRLVEILKTAGVYDDTLIVFTSDHGMAFPGGKTTVYEPGLNVPMIYKLPKGDPRAPAKLGGACQALVNHADLTPTLLDFAGGLPKTSTIQGRSYLGALAEEKPKGFDEVYASHTFHEITMYYPMRVVRTERYKLIWNIAAPLPYPFASDLWDAPTWQDIYKQGPQALYGKRTVKDYIQRPAFELYDLQADPHEAKNLAGDKTYAAQLAELKAKLKAFQTQTKDPWVLKWDYE